MRDQAKSSILLCNEKVAILPSGIDCSIFNYKGESKCKQDFNLRKDDTVVLLGAQHLSSPFKGVQLSIDALNKYIDKPLTVLTFGGGEVVLSNPLHKVINYGFVSNATAMAKLYGVADVFLCTSVAEGFGMTVAEAQCCGTPAVAFEQTGPSDIIVHKKSGYLAKFKEVSDVVLGLSFCLEAHFDREALARDAAQKFSIINCAKRYVSLYEEVIYEE
jgi:glycosyltransferase involved in cell wall biosynthesis